MAGEFGQAEQLEKFEKIGNVVLDLSLYSGEDLYTDGDIENEMLEIAVNHSVEEFPEIIEQKKSWPVFYHFSPFRSNIIDWLPIKKTDKILEIGSGCGAVTGALARRAGSVTCVELSKKRSLINAYRNREYGNITIKVGNFKDIEPQLAKDFDYVLLIGVFEYGQAYIGGKTPYEDFMRICNCHRKLDGRLIIAIENKFGLKYWAGCREDHLGTHFSGIEGYHEGGAARTFTRRGLENIMESVGIHEYFFYYPYPDYKFMTAVYSDKYLPKKGELSNNLRNFDRDRVLLFDETQVFDQIIDEREFPLFSNSYLVVAGGEPNALYAKFSNDRDSQWAIRTIMVKDAPGKLHVEKQPDTPSAYGHISDMQRAYELLSKRYEGTKIDINKCEPIGGDIKNGLKFEFCAGVTLESMLDECLSRADVEGFKRLVGEYMEWLGYNEESACVSNIDFIFPNILVDGGKWHVIDYEWTFERRISAKSIAFRAFYNYMLGGETRKACGEFLMHDVLGFSQEEIDEAVKRESGLQSYINGSRASVSKMRELIGNKAYELQGMLDYCMHVDKKYFSKIYVDYGGGFSEENSFIVKDCYIEEKYLRLQLAIPDGAVRLRIDPCDNPCVAMINEIKIDGRLYPAENVEVSGVRHESGYIIFDGNDPNMAVDVNGGRQLTTDIVIMEMPDEIAKEFTERAAKEQDGGFFARVKGHIKRRL